MKLPKYQAYTLLEMLVVMTIFVVLSFMAVSAFSGLRDTISLNEDSLNLEQDIRVAQRASLFLERDSDERWPYGIGLDFSKVETEGKYRAFTWCSQYEEYGAPRTTSNLPNFDDSLSISLTNGNMPFTYDGTECPYNDLRSTLVTNPDYPEVQITESFEVVIPGNTDVPGDQANKPNYILFESVSGRMFMYDSSGQIVNYASDGSIVPSTTDFVIEIRSLNTGKKKITTVQNISGKLNVTTEDV